LASTSSISKSLKAPLLAGLFLLGCSSIVKFQDSEAKKLQRELAKKAKVSVNYGPTLKEGGPYVDKTREYGLEGLQAVAFNAVDLNLDGYTDLSVLPTYYSRPKILLYNPSEKKFIPWDNDPFPVDFKASFLLYYDVNRDRVPDVISGVLNQRSEVSKIPLKLYLGKMKKGLLSFEESAKAFKIPAEPTSAVTLIDYNLDGWIDLFVSNWYEQKDGHYLPVPDRLLKNNKGVFEDVTPMLRGELTIQDGQIYYPNARPTYGASTCDIDQNGYPDILTVSSAGTKNKLWMNLKENRSDERYYDDIGPVTNYGSDPDGSLLPTGGGRNFFSACTDYNDDGIMDVFLGELSHGYDNDSVDKSSILTGSRETYPPYFIRTEYLSDAASESWNQGDRRGIWMDYNNDGHIDLLIDNSGFPPNSRLVMFEQDETHAFTNVAPQLGIDFVNPVGSIAIDLNQDGKLDIVTAQSNVRQASIAQRVHVFENQVQNNGRRSFRVHLQGQKSSQYAVGAMVQLFTQTPTKRTVQRRWVEYVQGGLASQNEEGVHFGVGAGVEVLGLKVRWPHKKKPQERLYSIKDLPVKEFTELTLCEDGKVMAGRFSCQF
jgi:hypothetical protein